jgi:hypothetical protein
MYNGAVLLLGTADTGLARLLLLSLLLLNKSSLRCCRKETQANTRSTFTAVCFRASSMVAGCSCASAVAARG